MLLAECQCFAEMPNAEELEMLIFRTLLQTVARLDPDAVVKFCCLNREMNKLVEIFLHHGNISTAQADYSEDATQLDSLLALLFHLHSSPSTLRDVIRGNLIRRLI